MEPGIGKVSFSMTSTVPNRRWSLAISLVTCGDEPWNVAESWAVPKPKFDGWRVSVATAAPTMVAADRHDDQGEDQQLLAPLRAGTGAMPTAPRHGAPGRPPLAGSA